MPLPWRTNRQQVAEALIEHLDALFRVALRLTGETAAAEDLVQETCLRAWQAAADLRQVTRVKSWLITILTHCAMDAARWHARHPTMPADHEGQPPNEGGTSLGRSHTPFTPEHLVAQREACAALKRALDELPATFRLPVFLVYVEGLSYQEVAESLDCPLGTVMSRLARGKALLRQRLRELETSPSCSVPRAAKTPPRNGQTPW